MFEAQPSKEREAASEVGARRASRSKAERIMNKMVLAPVWDRGKTKRCCVWAQGREREYRETILLLFARAGLLNSIFFFINNRVLGD
jgi:hypothetical protein